MSHNQRNKKRQNRKGSQKPKLHLLCTMNPLNTFGKVSSYSEEVHTFTSVGILLLKARNICVRNWDHSNGDTKQRKSHATNFEKRILKLDAERNGNCKVLNMFLLTGIFNHPPYKPQQKLKMLLTFKWGSFLVDCELIEFWCRPQINPLFDNISYCKYQERKIIAGISK